TIEANGDIRGSRGDLMNDQGRKRVRHYKEQAFMGFFEVLLNLRKIFSNIKYCKQDIEKFQPDALIFIDYSGFNLRIAKWAKPAGFKTFYYVSPQIWASRESRIES